MKAIYWKSLLVLICVCSASQTLSSQRDERGEALLKETIGKVKELNPNEKFLSFAFITDTHQRGNCNENRDATRNIKLFNELCNSGLCHFAVHDGDFFNAYNCPHDSAVSYLKQARAGFDMKIPFYAVKGNHDCNGKYHKEADMNNLDWEHQRYATYNLSRLQYKEVSTADWDGKQQLYLLEKDSTAIVTRYEFYDIFQKNLKNVVSNPADSCCNYYYTDLNKYKMRIVVLNEYDIDRFEDSGIHQKQADWIHNVALNFNDKKDPSSWGVCVLIHNAYLDQEKLLTPILSDFEKHPERGYLVGCIHGHDHEDEFNHNFGFNHVGVDRGYSVDKEKGTDDEFMFCIFTIDTDKRVLYETRLGRGNSRIFEF